MTSSRPGRWASGRRQGVLFLLALLAVSLAATPALAQRGTGRMQGRVTDPDGNPIEGVSVKAFNAEMTPNTLTATTDVNGRWAILGLSNDPWKFSFEKQGYIPLDIDANVRGLGRNPDMDVTLQPYEAAPDAIGGPGGGVDSIEIFEQGNALYDQGEYAAAIAQWEEFLALNPDVHQVLVNIGNAHRELGNVEEARVAYERVLETDPSEARALYNLAEMLVQEGKAEEAIPLFERVVEQAPDDPAVYYNVAELYFQQRVTDKAVQYYQRALEVDPAYLPALKQMGFAYVNMGELELAISAFQRFLEVAPEDNPDVPLVRDVLAALQGGV